MDLFSTYTVENTIVNGGVNTVTYFLHTVHGRKIAVVILTERSNRQYTCQTSTDWQHFLTASGFDRLLPMRFRSKDDVEHKINHLFARRLTMPLLTACPNSTTIHSLDVFGSSLVWCMLDMEHFERVKIPPCMHRHLFEHTKSEAILRYGNTAWPVAVRGYTFDHEFTNFLVENDIPFDGFVLLRHIGNFIFDVLLFDTDGYSRNLSEPPNANFNPNFLGDQFFVYAQSAISNCSYRKLFRPPSFLYIPTKTTTSACETFLKNCCDTRGQILIMHGEVQDPFYGGEMDLLQEIQFNFHLDPTYSLVFLSPAVGNLDCLLFPNATLKSLHIKAIHMSSTAKFAPILQLKLNCSLIII